MLPSSIVLPPGCSARTSYQTFYAPRGMSKASPRSRRRASPFESEYVPRATNVFSRPLLFGAHLGEAIRSVRCRLSLVLGTGREWQPRVRLMLSWIVLGSGTRFVKLGRLPAGERIAERPARALYGEVPTSGQLRKHPVSLLHGERGLHRRLRWGD